MASYIYFDKLERQPNRKTDEFVVRSKSDQRQLGFIKWEAGWRQYVFIPVVDIPTIWSKSCLADVIWFIADLMNERKKKQ